MRKATLVMLIGLGGIEVMSPVSAEGQLFRKVKEVAAREAVEVAVERVIKAGDTNVLAPDSTAEQGATPVDSVAVARFAADLAMGRLAIEGLRFLDGDRLDPVSAASLRNVARALRAMSGAYLVSVHVGAQGEAQRTADTRAAVVRAALVAAGFEAGRLFSAGYGTTGTGRTERIELLRVK